MNSVLYTHDLEPITVVDVPMWALDILRSGGHVQMEVQLHVPLVPWQPESPVVCDAKAYAVEITGELLRRRGSETLMLFTKDEVLALRLKAAFLPGQVGEVQDRQRMSFIRGAVFGFGALGGPV